MPRNLSPAVIAELSASPVKLAYFAKLEFLAETLWLWTGYGPITPLGPAWDTAASFPYGQTFTGLGYLGRIETIPQTTELTAENIRMVLSAIPSNLLSDAINGVRLSGSVTLWLAFLNAANQVIPDPLQMWQGQTDVPTIDEGAETSELSLTVENSLLALNLAANRRFTTLDQQNDFPGDAGFDFVTAMQDLYLPFPVGTTARTNITAGNLGSAPDGTSSLSLSVSGPQKLTLTGPSSTLSVIANAQFVTGPYAPNIKNVTAVGLWSSSDTNVATVTNGHGANILSGAGNFGTGGGLIQSVAPGNCTITFFFGTASISLTVSVA